MQKYLPFIQQRARAYAALNRRARHHYDDLVSEGYLRLVEMPDLEDQENPEGYLTTALNRAFDRYMRANSDVFSIPRNEDLDQVETSTPCGIREDTLVDTHANDPTLDTLLEGCCHNDLERSVVALRADGYGDSEISEMAGVARSKVMRIRKRVQTRYENAQA